MPFGKKSPASFSGNAPKHRKIDFDAVWEKFLKPALERAGCQPSRADSDPIPGDIRTDMFFEIVTADLVVADVTISNPNVYYELGVRHGVRSSAVLVINGRLEESQPFDIAADRSFRYDASLFEVHDKFSFFSRESREYKEKLESKIDEMAKVLRQAMMLDSIAVGSPVYSHLPGLREANWDDVRTSRTIYFNSLRDDWLTCVKNAQRLGRPGDILTLADDAPTLLHRTKILYEAALALIYLCRYAGAERILREVLQTDPTHAKAELDLAQTLAHQGKTDAAEQQLRAFLNAHADQSEASDLLGQVYRQLWHLSWRDEKNSKLRRRKALETAQLADSAIKRFSIANQSDPNVYYAGFNALILSMTLGELRRRVGRDSQRIEEETRQLIYVVDYVARNKREKAIQSGDYVEQFWTTTAIAGLHLIQDQEQEGIEAIREACGIAGATPFQVRSFRDRLRLLQELEVKPKLVARAMDLVEAALRQKTKGCGCNRVFLWWGHPVNERQLPHIEKEITKHLGAWKLREDDLVICDLAEKGDILFAEASLRTGARLRIMLLEPSRTGPHQPIWPFNASNWEDRFHALLRPGPNKEVWFHSRQLGAPFEPLPTSSSQQTAGARHRNWIFSTAQMEAEPTTADGEATPKPPNRNVRGKLYGLFMGPVQPKCEAPEDPWYLARLVNEFNGYQGQVNIIELP